LSKKQRAPKCAPLPTYILSQSLNATGDRFFVHSRSRAHGRRPDHAVLAAAQPSDVPPAVWTVPEFLVVELALHAAHPTVPSLPASAVLALRGVPMAPVVRALCLMVLSLLDAHVQALARFVRAAVVLSTDLDSTAFACVQSQ
jgi:hypothetical protein